MQRSPSVWEGTIIFLGKDCRDKVVPSPVAQCLQSRVKAVVRAGAALKKSPEAQQPALLGKQSCSRGGERDRLGGSPELIRPGSPSRVKGRGGKSSLRTGPVHADNTFGGPTVEGGKMESHGKECTERSLSPRPAWVLAGLAGKTSLPGQGDQERGTLQGAKQVKEQRGALPAAHPLPPAGLSATITYNPGYYVPSTVL